MRITYIGDLHIGSSLSHIFSLRARHAYRSLYDSWMKKFRDRVLEENPDLVVILGDLIDNSALTLSFRSLNALSTFYGLISELIQRKKQIIYITGNHDIRILDSSGSLDVDYRDVGSILRSFSDEILFVDPHKVSILPLVESDKILINIGFIEDREILPTLKKSFELLETQGYLSYPRDIIINGHFSLLFQNSPFYVKDGIKLSWVLEQLNEFLTLDKLKSLTFMLGHIHIFSSTETTINEIPIKLIYPGSPFPLSFGEAVNSLGSNFYSIFPRYLVSIDKNNEISFKQIIDDIPVLIRYRVNHPESQTLSSLKTLLSNKVKQIEKLSTSKILFLDHIIPEKTPDKVFQEYRERFSNFEFKDFKIYQRFRIKSTSWSPGEIEEMRGTILQSADFRDDNLSDLSFEVDIREFVRNSIMAHLDESIKAVIPDGSSETIERIKLRVSKILAK